MGTKNAEMNKVILVTGASSGIGKAISIHLAQQGYTVFGTSRKPSADFDNVRMVELDVTDDNSVERAVSQVIAEAGRIDVLINNAGSGICGAIEDTTIAEAHWQMETNFFGPIRMVKQVLPHMRSKKAGRIITISSLAGMAALPYQPFYSASKFAIEGMNEALRMELSGSGVDATTINPGDFKTGFTAARIFTKTAKTGIHAAQLAKTVGIYERDETHGADPMLVAQLAHRLICADKVGVRYTVGRFDQRLGIALKRILPATLFEWLMKKTYSLP
jgi:NAD(P)-dependent dehydrogenase (short-subunit alcohol dehydrogenase family)